jgi:type II secretory pathway component PulF
MTQEPGPRELSYEKVEPPWYRRRLELPLGRAGRVAGWIVLGAVTGSLGAAAVLSVGGYMGAVYLGGLALAAIVVTSVARRGLHRRRVGAVFAYVAQGMRANMPLAPYLRNCAGQEVGGVRKRLGRVVGELEEGYPVHHAICNALPELDRQQAFLLVSAGSCGTLPATLERLSREHARAESDPSKARQIDWLYWSIIMVAMGASVVMVSFFVRPKLLQILRDFQVKNVSAESEWWVWVSGVMCVIGAGMLWWIGAASFGSLVDRKETARRGAKLGREARHRRLSDLYFVAADQVGTGRPLVLGREEVGGWAASVEGEGVRGALSRGETLARAAKEAGLPKGDVAVLAMGQDSGRMEGALRLLAQHHAQKAERTRGVVTSLATVALVLIFGAVVLYQGMSIWRPMEKLADQASKAALLPKW